jgi:transcriptional regulator with XRE-family HTH domain
MNTIGNNIRKMREKKGFSQEALAYELNINQSTYGKLERNAANLSIGRLLKIAEVLDEDIADILEIGQKNVFNNQTNQGNGYVQTINNDYRALIDELKQVYEKVIAGKDEQIVLLKSLLEKSNATVIP